MKRFWLFLVEAEWTSSGWPPSQKLEENSSGNSNLNKLLDIIDNLWRGTFVDFILFFSSLALKMVHPAVLFSQKQLISSKESHGNTLLVNYAAITPGHWRE